MRHIFLHLIKFNQKIDKITQGIGIGITQPCKKDLSI